MRSCQWLNRALRFHSVPPLSARASSISLAQLISLSLALVVSFLRSLSSCAAPSLLRSVPRGPHRRSNIAAGEAGGITQGIGAFAVDLKRAAAEAVVDAKAAIAAAHAAALAKKRAHAPELAKAASDRSEHISSASARVAVLDTPGHAAFHGGGGGRRDARAVRARGGAAVAGGSWCVCVRVRAQASGRAVPP